MPANLPPQYYEAEKKFRAAKSPFEKIAAIEEMMSVTPKHKGTDHLRAELRSRIAKLNQMASKKSGGQRASMAIEKEGAAQVVIVGMPNSGKSSLLASVTNASPTVAEYPFATQNALPGMMPYEDIKIQLIDTPPLVPQAIQWWLPPLLRQADAVLLVIDLSQEPTEQLAAIREQLKQMRVLVGKETKTENEDEIYVWPKKALVIANKQDEDTTGRNLKLLKEKCAEELPLIALSTTDADKLEEMKKTLYQMLDIIRVYTKAPGQKADMTDPVILPSGSTMSEAAITVHKDFAEKLRYARIWGSGKHAGVMAKRDHIMADGDVIELHLQER